MRQTTHDIEDLPIKENEKFTPQHKKTVNMTPKDAHYSGLTLKNLPAHISETDLHAFLVTMGLPLECTSFNLKRSDRSTAVDTDGLNNDTCLVLIRGIHEKTFFNRTIYCRGVCNLFTPPKNMKVDESIKDKIIENGESHSLDKGALDNLEDQSLPLNSTPHTSKENARLAKKARQAKNRLEKLKSLKAVQ